MLDAKLRLLFLEPLDRNLFIKIIWNHQWLYWMANILLSHSFSNFSIIRALPHISYFSNSLTMHFKPSFLSRFRWLAQRVSSFHAITRALSAPLHFELGANRHKTLLLHSYMLPVRQFYRFTWMTFISFGFFSHLYRAPVFLTGRG